MTGKYSIPLVKFSFYLLQMSRKKKTLHVFSVFSISLGVIAAVLLSLSGVCDIAVTTCSLFLPACSHQRAQKRAFPIPPPPFSHHQTAPAEGLCPANQIPVSLPTTSVSPSVRRGAPALSGVYILCLDSL